MAQTEERQNSIDERKKKTTGEVKNGNKRKRKE
jgi:hypothetical protein